MTKRMVLEVRGIFIWILFCTSCWFLTVVTAAVETEILLGRLECHSKGDNCYVSTTVDWKSHYTAARSKV